ncbi:MAG: NeuD/PglB/VioB family sugar acetyltransferase [Ferruginibacter sp.]
MILIGYSGHSYVVHGIFVALGKKVTGYFDNEEKSTNPYNLIYYGKETSEEAFTVLKNDEFFIAIGDNAIRQKIYENFAARGCMPVNAIHPSAAIDPRSTLAAHGIMISSNVSVNALSTIGNAVICNTGCIIEHECELGDFVHIGPGTVLCGNVTVGKGTFIGANAVVRQGVQIGKNCVIGAGAVIIKDVADNAVVVGNPSRELATIQAKKHTEPVEIKPLSKLSILFIGKADDPYSKVAGEFISLHFPNTLAIYGKRGELFPKEAGEWEGDIIISYLSQWIIPNKVLNKASIMAINFHPGPPDYPGIGCTNFAVYDGASEYGVTCHHMLAKVDTGKIISVKRFPIYKTDTVFSITQRCYALILDQCFEIFDFIIQEKPLPESVENWTRKPFLRKELNRLCKITPDMPIEEINRRIRATNFVKHWAFMQVGDNIFKLVDDKK